jgi:hypothetical protein
MKILLDGTNLSKAELIASSIEGAKEKILSERFIPRLNSWATNNKMILKADAVNCFVNGKENGFCFYKEDWDFAIYFGFDKPGYRDFFWGISKVENSKYNEKVSKYDQIRKLDLENKTSYWATWNYFEDYKSWSTETFEDINNKKEGSKIIELIKNKIQKTIKLLEEKKVICSNNAEEINDSTL